MIARPNAWVAVDDGSATQLTYAPRVAPAPLTVSVPGRDPTLGSLVVVITNQTVADVAVASVTFTIVVGESGVGGAALMPATAQERELVSDPGTWSFGGPGQQVTAGTADYTLAPATGDAAVLAAGESVVVTLSGFETLDTPGTSTIVVAESVEGTDPAYTSIAVSTFPEGFFFDRLTVSVPSAGNLVPVAQVPSGSGVTLTWNSSLVDTEKQTVYWSSPTGGQQQATPQQLGEWSTPADAPLTSDTVFVVVVEAAGGDSGPMTASLSTAVAVQDPELVASSASVSGALSAGSATVGGSIAARGDISAGGRVEAASAAVAGTLEAGSAHVTGDVQADTLTAAGATITSSLSAQEGTVSVLTNAETISVPRNRGFGGSAAFLAHTDGLVVAAVTWPPLEDLGAGPVSVVRASGTSGILALRAGGEQRDPNVYEPFGDSFVLPVAAGAQCVLEWAQLPTEPSLVSFSWVALGSPPPGKQSLEEQQQGGQP